MIPLLLAAEVVIRMATVAPDGTSWARELKAFDREVQTATKGQIRVKWYFGAIAGGEDEVKERIERNQLDGAASGGMLCQRVAPSMRVTRVMGVFRSRDEASYALTRLNRTLEEEARKNGYALIGTTNLGPDIVFTRTPVTSMAELKKLRLWRWDLDDVGVVMSSEIGMQMVPMRLETAAKAFDDNRIDGFIAIPSATVAFQWFTRARHLLDLSMSYLQGCVVVANRTFDRLTVEQQASLRASSAKLAVRFNELGRQTDDALLGGVFAKQGVTVQVADASFRSAFFEAAREARTRLGSKLVPPELLQRVLTLLADYRAEHRNK
jgi:TRAP-type transport system periplasmic protein